MPSAGLLLNTLELGLGALFLILTFAQVMKRGWHGRLLRMATVWTFLVLIAGISFGKYYAGSAPKRLLPIETANPQKAVEGYTEAIQLSPDDPELYLRRGMTSFALGRYGDALADLSRCLARSPNDDVALLARGMIFQQLNDVGSASKDFEKADALLARRQTGEALVQRASIAGMRGKVDDAIAFAAQALTHNLSTEDRCGTLLALGGGYVGRNKSGDAENARRALTEAVSICDDFLNKEAAFFGRAVAFELLDKPEFALLDWNSALKLRPNDAVAFCNRGSLLLRLGKLKEALSDMNRAIELQPDYFLGYQGRAEVYSRLGDSESAEKDRAMATKLVAANGHRRADVFLATQATYHGCNYPVPEVCKIC